MDGSSEIKPAEDGGCGGEELMCTARGGKLAGEKICLPSKYLCDGYLNCEDASDEDNCEEEYLYKGIFSVLEQYKCRSPYLEIKNKTSKFYPMRGIR